MSIAEPRLMTSEELDAMPDDGVERWLINGQLREGGMTRRHRRHSRVEANIAKLLGNWKDQQPEPRGEVLVGEAGIRLRRNPDSSVGVDVCYVSPEVAQNSPDDEPFLHGPPLLVVKVLSPSDKQQEITEKLEAYLEADVKLVWIADPAFRTITVYRADAPPQLFNETQPIDAEPHLPGFRVATSQIFAR